MKEQTKQLLLNVNRMYYQGDVVNFEGKKFYPFFATDELVSSSQGDVPFEYAISADKNNLKAYELHFEWSEAPINKTSSDAGDWVDDWLNDVFEIQEIDEEDFKYQIYPRVLDCVTRDLYRLEQD